MNQKPTGSKKKTTSLLAALVLLVVFAITGINPFSSTETTTSVNTEASLESVKRPSKDTGKSGQKKESKDSDTKEDSAVEVDKDGTYTTKEEVAAYIHKYNELPSNFITKKEAQKLGWNSKEGNLDEVAPGKSIGGDYFGNYDKNLPEAKGRKYTECDINFDGGFRGGERIVFSNDGLIFYTNDHYNTFEQLY
ncbi:MAG: ribonuclease [Blautia sp.]|nr:ribonuclease [Blautia sp.]